MLDCSEVVHAREEERVDVLWFFRSRDKATRQDIELAVMSVRREMGYNEDVHPTIQFFTFV